MSANAYLLEGMMDVAGVMFCFWAPVTIFVLAKKWMK